VKKRGTKGGFTAGMCAASASCDAPPLSGRRLLGGFSCEKKGVFLSSLSLMRRAAGEKTDRW